MKNTTLLLVTLVTMTAFKGDQFSKKKKLIPDTNMLHIGIVVEDIEIGIDQWMKLVGNKERPKIINATGHGSNPTTYRGKSSDAQAKLAFFSLDNLQIELIEPIGEAPSHWQEFLNHKGPGVHHIAFEVNGIRNGYIELYEENGFPLAQKGGWGEGEYAYMDGLESLGVMVELIERYKP